MYNLHFNVAADVFDFRIKDDGSYALSADGKLWLESGPTFFNGFGKTWSTNSSANPLMLKKVTKQNGTAPTEKWAKTMFQYELGDTNTTVIATVMLYSGVCGSGVLFTQSFPDGAVDTKSQSGSYDETLSGFPSFKVQNGSEALGYLSYGGSMFGWSDLHIGTFDSKTDSIRDGIKGGPLSIFNMIGEAIVISPFNNFMAASLWHDSKMSHVAWGIMSGVNEIPKGFSYSTLMVFDTGINRAFQTWGKVMSLPFGSQHAKERQTKVESDLSLNYLGYWTDNGAYYYYHTESGKSYEDTMLDVKKYVDDNHIPYKYLQLDSWWYPKDSSGAVITWTPMKEVFPDGIKYVSDKTNWPIGAHNRYWSKNTPYAKQNGGNFTFVMGEKAAVPNDPKFWEYLLAQARGWGLFLYEQDWLYVTNREVSALETSLTLGHDWLMQMADGAAKNNQTIQYCMSYSRHAMQSLEFPTVTQARVSGDYLHSGFNQWRVGVSSIFAWAMSIRPYKDTFWTTSVQPGNPYHIVEPHPELQAVVASLTTGPVGPSDMINGTNMTLLMRCCNQDGRLLRPSRPATAIDAQIMTDAFRTGSMLQIGEIWSTHSDIVGVEGTKQTVIKHGILLAAGITDRFSVRLQDLGFPDSYLTEGIFYPYNDWNKWQYFNQSVLIDLTDCGLTNFCLFHFAPYVNSPFKMAVQILGEVDKWVPMSSDRINRIVNNADSTVDLVFNPTDTDEKVEISYVRDYKLYTKQCSLLANIATYCRI